jgi:hypothetical protein
MFFESEPLNVKIGEVHTPFHHIKLRVQTSCVQVDVIGVFTIINQIETPSVEEKKDLIDFTKTEQSNAQQFPQHPKQHYAATKKESVLKPASQATPFRPASAVRTRRQGCHRLKSCSFF